MVILEFGFCPLKIRKAHEFGDRRLKKLLRIDLLILTVFILDRGVFFQAAHALRNNDCEWIKSVRLARAKARKRGMAEGRNHWKAQNDTLREMLENKTREHDRLYRENYGLKIAVKALGGNDQ